MIENYFSIHFTRVSRIFIQHDVERFAFEFTANLFAQIITRNLICMGFHDLMYGFHGNPHPIYYHQTIIIQ
jgi:hypothetical protein